MLGVCRGVGLGRLKHQLQSWILKYFKINILSTSQLRKMLILKLTTSKTYTWRIPEDQKIISPLQCSVPNRELKISYQTLQNMGGEISQHNKNILGSLEETPAPRCNCRAANKQRCPLPNYSMFSCVVYRAQVTNEVDNSVATYTGLTEIPSNCQLGSMRLISGATSLMILTTTHQVQGWADTVDSWWPVKTKLAFNPSTGFCKLCSIERY